MQTFLLLATVYAAGFDPVPKVEPLPPITEKMWQQSDMQLKQIGLALHDFHDHNGFFPQDLVNDKGKPLLSWRVQLLLHINEKVLYEKFKLNEAWDSDHNKKLIEKMPALFSPVRAKVAAGSTFYQGFTGKGTIFRKGEPVRMGHIVDGTGNTAMVVEAGESAPWTKPEDIPFDPKKDIPKLGGEFDGDFNLLLADGSVKKIKKKYNMTVMNQVIQMDDGNNFYWDGIEKK